MNTDIDTNGDTSNEERVIDALLAEHARLKGGSDVDLVNSVLKQTVDLPPVIAVSSMPKVEVKQPVRLGRGEWLKLVAAVAATAIIGSLVLSGFKTESGGVVQERKEDVFHVVVVSPGQMDQSDSGMLKRKVELLPMSNSDIQLPEGRGGAYELEITELVDSSLEGLSFGGDKPFGASVDFGSLEKVSRPSFTVASDACNKVDGRVIYSGNAVLNSQVFTIEADSIVMEVDSEQGSMVKALNARITHHDGLYQSVSEAVSFDPNSGKMTARGLSRLVRRGVEQEIAKESLLYIDGTQVGLVEVFSNPE